MRAQGLPVLPHQTQALARAGEQLDGIRPQAARDMAAAFARDPALAVNAAGGRPGAAIQAMTHEARVRTGPELASKPERDRSIGQEPSRSIEPTRDRDRGMER